MDRKNSFFELFRFPKLKGWRCLVILFFPIPVVFYILFFSELNFAATVGKSDGMVRIEGGTFTPLYGSLKKPIEVEAFQLDPYPVTNADFLKFLKKKPEWQRSSAKKIFIDKTYLAHWKGDLELGSRAPAQAPVVNISWYAANAFCESHDKRLPSVNEWEFVASQPIPGKDFRKVILDWYSVPSPDVLPSVKTGFKNSSGVASLHGLIWEWTLDFNSAMVTGESRADGSLDKSLFCGSGSMGAADKSDYAAFMRFGFRSSLKANYTISNLGFRCAKSGQP